MMVTPKRLFLLASIAAASLLLSACGVSVGDTSEIDSATVSTSPTTIPAADVETKGQDALEKETGKDVPPLSCPEDLDLKVGASEECSLTGDDLTVTATVTSASTDTGDYELNFKVSK